MATTYMKRQKEMKRLEKQREKAERRAQRKLISRQQKELQAEGSAPADTEASITTPADPSELAPRD